MLIITINYQKKTGGRNLYCLKINTNDNGKIKIEFMSKIMSIIIEIFQHKIPNCFFQIRKWKNLFIENTQ
jgi:hypothetical protein